MPQLPQIRAVLQHIDENRLERRLVEMIDIYSPSGQEEPILAYVQRELEQHGISYIQQSVTETLHNLIIPLGSGNPEFFLIGHVDTIDRRHRKTHKAVRLEDTIEGLGAADMKGGVAAMMEAWIALHHTGYPSDAPGIALGLFVDEEESARGVSTFVQDYRPQMAVIGEPTDLSLCTHHYGYCELHLTSLGRRVHSAIPEHGHNAILDMMNLIQELYNLEPPPGLDPKHWKHLNLRELLAPNSDFVVPERCEAWLDIHLHAQVSPVLYQATIESILSLFHSRNPNTQIDHLWPIALEGFHLSPQEPLVQICQSAAQQLGIDESESVFRSHSDANLLVQHGTACVMMGPGALETAHTVHETIRVRELHQAARLYSAIALAYARYVQGSEKH